MSKTNTPPITHVTNPFRIIRDTREQLPYSFHGLKTDADKGNKPLLIQTIDRHLKTGDYSIDGLESQVTVERKSLSDLYGTLTHGRAAFIRELERMQEMEFSAVVVEASWDGVIHKECDYCHGAGGYEKKNVIQDHVFGLVWINSDWTECTACDGKGSVHPLENGSRVLPKTIVRSMLAMEQRYPKTHWHRADSRRLAEVLTFRILERFWKDQKQEHGK